METIEPIQNIPSDEQETVILITKDQSDCSIYTTMPTWVTKLNKLLAAPDTPWKVKEKYRNKDGSLNGATVVGPKDLVRVKSKKKVMNEEEKAAFAIRLGRTPANKDNSDNIDSNESDDDE